MEKNKCRVLICVDGHPLSEQSLKYYCRKLHKPKNEVIVLYVSDSIRIPIHKHIKSVINPDQILEETNKIQIKNQIIVTKFNQLCNSYKLNHKVLTTSGNAGIGASIVDFIERFSIKYVVIGTRQLGKVQSAILGSVSSYVIHHSSVPVAVCPPSYK